VIYTDLRVLLTRVYAIMVVQMT